MVVKVKLSDGFLEVTTTKSIFTNSDIVKLNMYRPVNVIGNIMKSEYKINLTAYNNWYEENQDSFDFPDIEKESYELAQNLSKITEDTTYDSLS